MILKIGMFFVVALLLLLVITFFAVRIPALEINTQSSEKEKLLALEKWLYRIHKSGKFNGTVLLSKNGKVTFSKSYGYDSAESLNPLTEHSSYNLASVSKQFTAIGVVLLHNQSKLKYTDKLSEHIPELAFYNDITIQHLLYHTSGLPDYMQLAAKHGNDGDIFTTTDMISLYQIHHPNLNFEPGSRFQYSNAGYVLLAEIIERVSDISFQTFMSSNIFNPLNMKNTQVFNLLTESEPTKRVYGYKSGLWLFGGKKLLQDLNYFDGVAGDGGVYSSAHDLYLWHKALREGSLVSNELYNIAYIPAQLNNGSETKYGFGWFINTDKSVEHAGGWQGFTSYIHRNLEKDELIVILDNSSNSLRVNSIGFRFNSIGLNLQYFMNTI